MNNYYVIEQLGQNVEYIITEGDTDDGVMYQLHRSLNETWSEDSKGELLVSLENDGNGFKYKFKPREKKRVDYDEIEWLYLLIDFVRKQDSLRSIYNVCQYA
jgi:hypothetical protein